MFGPSAEDIRTIKAVEFWKTDLDAYHEITRYEPHRTTLDVTGPGVAGETRIHPLLNWPEEHAEHYFERHRLLRHPLYYYGYGSIGDWTTTKPGVGRTGRELPNNECGLHRTKDNLLSRQPVT